MDQGKVQSQKPDIFYKPNNLSNYYEYRVYDKNIYPHEQHNFEYSPCTILLMSRHQGFQWNDELFVNAYRRSAGYDSHKSPSLESRDQKIKGSTGVSPRPQQQSSDIDSSIATDSPPEVIDINLTEADRDVWP